MAELSVFGQTIFERSYAFFPGESWEQCARRVAKRVANNAKQEEQFFDIINNRLFVPGGRYLATAGHELFQCGNCYGMVVEDSRESWAKLLHDCVMCLSMGGGIGINYSRLRENGAPIKRMGGVASGPIALMNMVNTTAKYVMAGGRRRDAFWGG